MAQQLTAHHFSALGMKPADAKLAAINWGGLLAALQALGTPAAIALETKFFADLAGGVANLPAVLGDVLAMVAMVLAANNPTPAPTP